jgi:hypothetical protein
MFFLGMWQATQALPALSVEWWLWPLAAAALA